MAEAVAGTPMSRFFCHKCNVEIEDLLPDYTCPRCTSGFIEELQSDNDENCTDMEHVNERNWIDHEVLDQLRVTDRGQTSSASNRNNVPSNFNNISHINIQGNRGSNRGHGLSEHPRSLLVYLEDALNSISDASLSYRVTQDNQPPRYSNTRDVILGHAGFDLIVTQVLHQLDGTAGPPPLPKKLIDKIPTTTITQSEVDSKIQCSVCWEDFNLSEPVKQLPCLHLYHAPCILPWLELHGTCPICRRSIGDQNTMEANRDIVRQNLTTHFRATNDTNNTRASSTLPSASSSTGDSSSAS